MKKKLLLLINLFISAFAFAQNYQTVISSRNGYFKSADIYHQQINGLHIDSITMNGNDSVFYNYKVLELELNGPAWCADGYDTSWTGRSFKIKSNGENVFYNQFGDSIIINTNANVNNAWPLYNYPNGSWIEASVTAINQQTILGFTDSVKVISLQAKDYFNTNIANDFNGLEIIIGKETGFIKAYNFNLFPADTVSFNLVGITNPDFGVKNITTVDVFNFDVGDNFHCYSEWQAILSSNTIEWEERTVLSKNLYADSVQYSFARIYFREDYNWPNLTTFFLNDTLTSTYNFNVLGFNNQPFQLYSGSFSPGTNGFVTTIHDTTYNSRIKKHVNENLHDDTLLNNCITPTIADCAAREYTYAEGLGLISINDPTCFYPNSMNMVYYQKGSETWGNRLKWSTILGVNNLNSDLKCSVFPNPFNEKLQLDFAYKSLKAFEVSIVDLLGQKIFNQHFQNQSHIDINTSSFKCGVYILNIQSESKSFNYKIVK